MERLKVGAEAGWASSKVRRCLVFVLSLKQAQPIEIREPVNFGGTYAFYLFTPTALRIRKLRLRRKKEIVRDSRSIDPEFGPVAVQSSLRSSQSSSLKSEQVGGRERKSEEL